MVITNLINTKGRAVPNQFVIYDDDKIIFQSYESIIITIDKSNRILEIGSDYNYSMTTIKHRNKFLTDFFGFEINSKILESAIKKGQLNDYNINLDF